MNTPSSDRTHFLPSHVHGTADERYAGVARAFGRLFAGRGGGGALCVYHHGTKVIDIWTGTSDHLGVRPWTADTAAIAMSVTKCVAATVIHRLSDRGLIDYDAPVAEYWPEFGAQGKSDITVREVLSHRAGLSPFSTIASTIDELLDHHLSEQRIAASAPTFLRGMPAYHGLTYGVLLAGLARAVTGHGMAELFQTEVAQPLGIDDFHLGRPPGGSKVVPATFHGSAASFRRSTSFFARSGRIPGPPKHLAEALALPGTDRLYTGSDPACFATEFVSGGGLMTARGMATLFSALASGGEFAGNRLLSGSQVEALSQVQTTAFDQALGLRARWRLGFHQFPRLGPSAYGHIGLGGSGGWADPRTGLAAGFVQNRLPSLLLPIDQRAAFRLAPKVARAALKYSN